MHSVWVSFFYRYRRVRGKDGRFERKLQTKDGLWLDADRLEFNLMRRCPTHGVHRVMRAVEPSELKRFPHLQGEVERMSMNAMLHSMSEQKCMGWYYEEKMKESEELFYDQQ